MKDKLRIGEISYANCTPIFSMLRKLSDCRDYEFVPGEPAALNSLLARGEVDVSASSSIEYARHWREYLIVPDISISSEGDIKSILLFSKRPLEELGGQKVSVSSASATSTVLLKVLLKNKYNVGAELVPKRPRLSSMLDGSEAALLIGDEALKEGKAFIEGSGLAVHDLGALWREFTGLPFVFALWMVREDSAKRMPGVVGRLKGDLLSAKQSARENYGEIASLAPEREWMGESGLVEYWRKVSYDLGEGHKMGLAEFFRLAEGVGEVSGRPSLRFL